MELREHEGRASRRRPVAALARPLRSGRTDLAPAELQARQETFRGFGDGLSLAFELAVVPFIFGLGGYALDRWLDTAPVFMILLALISIVGLFARTWYDYEQRMQAHDAAGPWARVPAGAGRGGEPETATPDRNPRP